MTAIIRYVVISDYRLDGVYLRRSFAERLRDEIQQYPVNWRQRPAVFAVITEDDLPEEMHQTPAYSRLRHWLIAGRTGRAS